MSGTEQRLGVYEFDTFRLDVVERSLWRRQRRIPLGGRAFDVLAALVRQAGRLITKEDLLQQAWKGRVVEEGNIHVQISTLRRLLGEKAISTVSGHGYRFELPIGAGSGSAASESNLPAALNPLVSREREVHELSTLLSRQRLVTVKGMGGIGKSSVAAETCRHLQQANTALRCWHVPVGASEQGDALQSTILHAVDRRPKAGKGIDESLVTTLREKPTLLLLDGCEMIADAAAHTARKMLEQCPELKIVCTSRKSLGLVGESVFELPPLPLEGARKLFLERAASASRSFEPSQVDTKLLDKILRKLDGIPLAIELAASRLRAIGLKDLEQQLADRLGTLVANDRSLPSRQSTLRATLEWSYRLLSDEERSFLNRVTIFQAPFTAEAAAYVGIGPDAQVSQAIDLLTGLVDKSLVTPEVSHHLSRYRILDSVREYGQSELSENLAKREIQERRAEYCLNYVTEAVKWQSKSEWLNDRLHALRVLWPDLAASLHYTIEAEKTHVELGAKLAASLIYFWVDEGRTDEAQQWLERACKRTGISGDSRLALSHSLGCAYAEKGMAKAASEKLGAAVRGYKKLGTRSQELAISANELGASLFSLQDYRGARKNYRLAVQINRSIGNIAREGQALQNLAVLELVSARISLAEQLFVHAIDLHERAGNIRSESTSAIWLAECKFLTGDFAAARELLDKAKALRSPITADLPSASIAFRFARCSAMQGEFAVAGRASLEAMAILEPIGNLRALLECLDAIAIVALAMNQHSQFAALMQAINLWRTQSGNARGHIWQRYFSDLESERRARAPTVSARPEQALGVGDVGMSAIKIAKDIANYAITARQHAPGRGGSGGPSGDGWVEVGADGAALCSPGCEPSASDG